MGTKLRRMLEKHRDKLCASIVSELRQSDAEHYQQIDPDLLEERTNHFIDQFLEAMAGKSAEFTKFILRLTEERMAEGYYLSEIQTALNTLDEQACDLALKHSDESKVDKHLLRICRTISLAKDELTRTYYLGKQQAEHQLQALAVERAGRGTAPEADAPGKK